MVVADSIFGAARTEIGRGDLRGTTEVRERGLENDRGIWKGFEICLMVSRLVELCIESACQSRDSIERWRRQKRSLERLPSQLAELLFRRLHARRLLFPSLLEVFKDTIEEIDLRAENAVDAEWMAYLGAFHFLRSLNISGCHRVTSSGLWAIAGMPNLKELDLGRCSKVTDAGITHLLSISTLEKLYISETGVTAYGISLLSSLKNLTVLDLGGLPVTDQALRSLQVLKKLKYLDLWGSKISDQGLTVVKMFLELTFLNVAWTIVTKFPNLPHLECLNVSNCGIKSILEEDGDEAPLRKLIASGATFSSEAEHLVYVGTSFLSFLDMSNTSLRSFYFLSHMKALESLDLSSTVIENDSMELIACVGENLKTLNLSKTRVSSLGVGILAGTVPNLETLLLSHTLIDDGAISFFGNMPSLKIIDISNTNIKGFIQQSPESDLVLSLTNLRNLGCLEMLNLEQTQVNDAALLPLSTFKGLSHLLLKSASLTDISLSCISSISSLISLSFGDAVLTNQGLESLKPSATLRKMDLRGCWLLTKDALSAFSKRFRHIEVIHELFHALPSDRTVAKHSPVRFTRKTTQENWKNGEMVISPMFIDQRLKYGREELLALQYSSLSVASAPEIDSPLQMH